MKMRQAALRLLNEWETEGKYINLALSSHVTDSVAREERAALTALLYTTVEHKISYDYYIAALSKRSLDKLSPKVVNILRLGLCQIIHMDKIPSFAAVNESVDLASGKGERAIVNAVLRAAVRALEGGGLPLPPYEKSPARHYSVKYSFPLWLVRRFIAWFGEEEAVRLMEAYNTEPPLDVSVNTLRISRSDFIRELMERGVSCEASPVSECSVRIYSKGDPTALYGFSEGYFFVQDEASAAAVLALSPKVGDRVVDVCAAPGGKSFLSAILMGDKGEVRSFDIHESKLSLISSGAERLGLRSVFVDVRDAREPKQELLGRVDKLIVDAPCSGLGVLSKKSDLRYRPEEGTDLLPDLQLEILTASSGYLCPGGELVYSTCTLNPDENCGVVRRFLEENSDYESLDFTVGDIASVGGCLTLYPHVHGTDGFFIAKMRKK